MKTIAALQAWNNFSEYYAGQVGKAIADKYSLTVTYNQDPAFLNSFDIVWSFFPQFPKCRDLDDKLVKTFWEPHELGWDKGKVNVASSTAFYRQLLRADHGAKLAPLGIDTDAFFPKPFLDGIATVGWAGEKANERKQFKVLDGLMRSIPNICWEPNITTCVGGHYIGRYKSIPDMNTYYNDIDIYVCASAGEGFGLPLLEASSCGRPIVTFDVGIARELKSDGAGIIIVDSFSQMREEVNKLAGDRERIKKLGAYSRHAVEAYWTWNHAREAWLAVFDSV